MHRMECGISLTIGRGGGGGGGVLTGHKCHGWGGLLSSCFLDLLSRD